MINEFPSTEIGDECWLFCCRRPMVYIGGWRRALASIRPDDPRAFLEGLIDPDDGPVDRVWEGVESGNVSLYVYHCKSCGRHRATWDTD